MVGRFEGADGIRGLACLIVLCTHMPGFFFPDISRYFSGTGKIGVWLFFVLSAFLLTTKFMRTGFSAAELSNYMLGRTLRILPMFLLAIAIYWHFGSAGIGSVTDAIHAATFQVGFAHLWTIPVEFKFYFLLPVIAFGLITVKKLWGNTATLAFTLALVLGQQILWPYWNTPENSIATHWYISCFLWGCFGAVAMDKFRVHASARNANIAGALIIFAMVLLSPGPRNLLFGAPVSGWLMDKFIYLGLLWMLFVMFLADGKGMIGAVLKTPFMTRIGAWSYSIYLIHWLVYAKLSAGHQDSVIWACVALVGAIGSGGVLYYLVESPVERLRHSLQFRAKQKMSVPA